MLSSISAPVFFIATTNHSNPLKGKFVAGINAAQAVS